MLAIECRSRNTGDPLVPGLETDTFSVGSLRLRVGRVTGKILSLQGRRRQRRCVDGFFYALIGVPRR